MIELAREAPTRACMMCTPQQKNTHVLNLVFVSQLSPHRKEGGGEREEGRKGGRKREREGER